MKVVKWILTAFGGASSHAALVSRQMGKTCVVGCGALNIDYEKGTVTVGNKVLKEGDWISIDGFTGEVFAGEVATKPSEVLEVLLHDTLKPEQSPTYQRFAKLMEWADANRRLKVRANAETEAEKVMTETGVKIAYLVGTMIEVPRAAVTADEIAKTAEFFNFGTNDLTQTTLGMSRDDYGGFIGFYRENDIVPNDPFQTIDRTGVGKLMQIGVQGGRSSRKDLKIGICGEHGGDPASVFFCHEIGLDYVSCSPRRIPIARLAAAQAALEGK